MSEQEVIDLIDSRYTHTHTLTHMCHAQLVWSEGSSAAIPFGTMIALILMWFLDACMHACFLATSLD